MLSAQIAAVLVHFKEEKYEIYMKHMKAQLRAATLRSLKVRQCKRKLMFSGEKTNKQTSSHFKAKLPSKLFWPA